MGAVNKISYIFGDHVRVRTFEAWRVRCKTVIVWSWAATSSRLFGRLYTAVRNLTKMARPNGSYYFSTHGCSLVLSSFGVGPLEEEAPVAAAAAARALLLKKFDIIAADGSLPRSGRFC